MPVLPEDSGSLAVSVLPEGCKMIDPWNLVGWMVVGVAAGIGLLGFLEMLDEAMRALGKYAVVPVTFGFMYAIWRIVGLWAVWMFATIAIAVLASCFRYAPDTRGDKS